MSKTLKIYTDGASNVHNPKQPGGWAYVIAYAGMMICSSWGGDAPTTNQRMEMFAPIQALSNLKNHNELESIQYEGVEIITDSAYVYRGMVEQWYVDWKYYGNYFATEQHGADVWKNKDGEAIKNQDLWELLIEVTNKLRSQNVSVVFTKIRGHKGILYNEVCDKLAKKGKLQYS